MSDTEPSPESSNTLIEFRTNKKLKNFFNTDDSTKRLKSILQYLEVSHEFEQRAFFSTQYSQIYSCFLDALKTYDARNKTLHTAELVTTCTIVKKIVTFLPNIIKTKWQYKSLVYLVKCLLVTANKHLVRMLGVEIYLLLLDSISSSADDSLLSLFPSIVNWSPFLPSSSSLSLPINVSTDYNGVLVACKSHGITVQESVEIFSFILSFIDYKDIRRFSFYYDLLKVQLFPYIFPEAAKILTINLEDTNYVPFKNCPLPILTAFSDRIVVWLKKSYHRVVICRDSAHLVALLHILSQCLNHSSLASAVVDLYSDWLMRSDSTPKILTQNSDYFDSIMISQFSSVFSLPADEAADGAVLRVLSTLKELTGLRPLSDSIWKELLLLLIKAMSVHSQNRVHSRRLYDVILSFMIGSECGDSDIWSLFLTSCHEAIFSVNSVSNVFLERFHKSFLVISSLLTTIKDQNSVEKSEEVFEFVMSPKINSRVNSTPVKSPMRHSSQIKCLGLGEDIEEVREDGEVEVTSEAVEVKRLLKTPNSLEFNQLAKIWSKFLQCIPTFENFTKGQNVFDRVKNSQFSYSKALLIVSEVMDVLNLGKFFNQEWKLLENSSEILASPPTGDVYLSVFGPIILTSLGLSRDFMSLIFDPNLIVSSLELIDSFVFSHGLMLLSQIIFNCRDSESTGMIDFTLSLFGAALSNHSNLIVVCTSLYCFSKIHQNFPQNCSFNTVNQKILEFLIAIHPILISSSLFVISDLKRLSIEIDLFSTSFPGLLKTDHVISTALSHLENSILILLPRMNYLESSILKSFDSSSDVLSTTVLETAVNILREFLIKNHDSLQSNLIVSVVRILSTILFVGLNQLGSIIESLSNHFQSILTVIATSLSEFLTTMIDESKIQSIVGVIELCSINLSINPNHPELFSFITSSLSIIFDGVNTILTILVASSLNDPSFSFNDVIISLLTVIRSFALKYPSLILNEKQNLTKFLANIQLLTLGQTSLIDTTKALKLHKKLSKSLGKSAPGNRVNPTISQSVSTSAHLSLQLILSCLGSFPFQDGCTFLGTTADDVLANSCVRILALSSNSIVILSENSSESRITVRNAVGRFSFNIELIENTMQLSNLFNLAEQPCASSESFNLIDREVSEPQSDRRAQFSDGLASILTDSCNQFSDLKLAVTRSRPNIQSHRISVEKSIKNTLNQRKVDTSPIKIDYDSDLSFWKSIIPQSSRAQDRLYLCRLFLVHLGLVHPVAASSSRVQSISPCQSFYKELARLDHVSGRDAYDVIITYAGQNQRTFEDFVGNVEVSQNFNDFVSSLGWVVDVTNHPGFCGSLHTNQSNFENIFSKNSTVYFANETSELCFYVLPALSISSANKMKFSRLAPIQIIFSENSNILDEFFSSNFSISSITRLIITITPSLFGFRVSFYPSSNCEDLIHLLPPFITVSAEILPNYLRNVLIVCSKILMRSTPNTGLATRSQQISELITRYSKPVDSVDVLCNLLTCNEENTCIE
ncbi:hypothetical protein RCL1_001899 [Eukaryota sp. TZLM3-RCL]